MVPDGSHQSLDLLSEAVSDNVPSHLITVCQDSYKDSAVALIKLCGQEGMLCEHTGNLTKRQLFFFVFFVVDCCMTFNESTL